MYIDEEIVRDVEPILQPWVSTPAPTAFWTKKCILYYSEKSIKHTITLALYTELYIPKS
jgi:hypothetical protein